MEIETRDFFWVRIYEKNDELAIVGVSLSPSSSVAQNLYIISGVSIASLGT